MKEDKKKERGEVSRRDFLVGAGAVVVGGAIGAGIAYPLASGGDGGGVTTTTKVNTVTVPTTVTTTKTIGEGDVITETVTQPGGTVTVTQPGGDVVEPAFEEETTVIEDIGIGGTGSEPVAVDVKNGKIVRIRPLHLDSQYTREELAPTRWKIEAKGKTYESSWKSLPSYFTYGYRKRIYAPNRVKYPLKRVDWEPGGDPAKINAQNRGKSKFKRISWDEATTIIADEITRVHEAYGPGAVCTVGQDGHAEAKNVHRCGGAHILCLNSAGGYTLEIRNADSWEGWYFGPTHVWGFGDDGLCVAANVPFLSALSAVPDISENTDIIFNTGADWETTPQGFDGQFHSKLCYWFTEVGIKHVYITPELNFEGQVHADKWIPVLPNTDMAWQIAVIYTWIDEDTYDKDYVETHTIGFDKIKAYVMGDEDGVPKTPEWASSRCGIPEWTIKAIARQWASHRCSTQHYFGSPMARGPYAHEPARWEAVQLGMQGLGKPGVHQIHHSVATQPRTTISPSTGAAMRCMMMSPFPPQIVPRTMLHHVILESDRVSPLPFSWYGSTCLFSPTEDQFQKYTYPISAEEGGGEIHMLWSEKTCNIACWNNGNMIVEAYRSPKIECYVANHQWLENDCLFADIVLPVTSKFEDEDILSMYVMMGGENNVVSYQPPAIDAIGESKSDYEIALAIAEKLGVYEEVSGGKTISEWVKYGWETSGIADIISWEDLKEKGYYIAEIAPDFLEDHAGLLDFYNDPVTNPQDTPSGLLEFYSQRLADSFPDDNERGPMPKYVIGGPGWTHDESIEGERFKQYPLLCEANHPRWRHHVQCDQVPWLREIPTCKVKGYDGYLYEPVWIHPDDAAARNIAHGDIVKVYNERGTELGGAYVTQMIKTGAVHMDHGARIDYITDKVNRGGTVNPITPENPTSQNCWGEAVSGFLVEVEKLDPAEMEDWRKTYPEAFERFYNPAYGQGYSSWVEGGAD